MGFNGLIDVVKADDLTSFSTLPLYSLGAKHHQNGNEYVYVYNCDNYVIAPGKYAVLELTDTATSGYTVTVTNASLGGVFAGVAQASIGTASYGWLMVKGRSLISTDSGEVSQATGTFLSLGTDGGFVAAGATFSTAPRHAVALNSFVTGAISYGRIFGSVL
jgi:hypothetical protein